LDRCLGPAAGYSLPQRRRGEDTLAQEERATDLLVGGHRHGRESGARRQLRGRQQKARLTDAWLTLKGHRRQVGPRALQLMLDGRQLDGAPHNRAGHAAQLDR